MYAVFAYDLPGFFQLVGQQVLDQLHAVGVTALANALAVAERRPVERVLVYQQAACAGHILHECAVVKPACLGDIGNLDCLAYADICGSALYVLKKGPAHG